MDLLQIFTSKQSSEYEKYLKSICSLSRLASSSDIPFLHYRIAENLFCLIFNAKNLSRKDLAYDAKISDYGFGIKTFVSSGKSFEKIAEFNRFSTDINRLKGLELSEFISNLRNERIHFANKVYNIHNSFYHCIARKKKVIQIFNTNYDFIDINSIKINSEIKKTFHFSDKNNEYSFNFSKSTLYKRFYTPSKTFETYIEIIDDPFNLILELYNQFIKPDLQKEIPGIDYVILPLYSLRLSNSIKKVVSQKSGLNQWNAGGRKRNIGEVYLSVPIIIHKKFPVFFPKRHLPFNLHLPSDEIFNASICQANGKAIMTNPNKALSQWLLRTVLDLKEGELLTYNKLKKIGIDSVKISKTDEHNFSINFSKIGSFEIFYYNYLR